MARWGKIGESQCRRWLLCTAHNTGDAWWEITLFVRWRKVQQCFTFEGTHTGVRRVILEEGVPSTRICGVVQSSCQPGVALHGGFCGIMLHSGLLAELMHSWFLVVVLHSGPLGVLLHS